MCTNTQPRNWDEPCRPQGSRFRVCLLLSSPNTPGWRRLLEFLAANGYSTENRGEQTWCLAVKRGELPVERYPEFLYSE